jgi:hypothetical protein
VVIIKNKYYNSINLILYFILEIGYNFIRSIVSDSKTYF